MMKIFQRRQFYSDDKIIKNKWPEASNESQKETNSWSGLDQTSFQLWFESVLVQEGS